jgi:hypothetical protein
MLDSEQQVAAALQVMAAIMAGESLRHVRRLGLQIQG